MAEFEYLLFVKSSEVAREWLQLPGARLDDLTVRIPATEAADDLRPRFLQLAAAEGVEKAALSLVLPSKLRVGSLLYQSRWVAFTVTTQELEQHLRIDPWDCMAEFFLESLPGRKRAYAIGGGEAHKWSVETASWALYLAHACRRESLVEPEWEPSAEEERLISAQPIQLDLFDYQADCRKIRFLAELTYDQYFTLRDYEYLLRLRRDKIFRYDTPLYNDESRLRFGLDSDLAVLLERARRNFPDRSYDSVDIIVRNAEGARECGEVLQSLGFGVSFFDDHSDQIWEWPGR